MLQKAPLAMLVMLATTVTVVLVRLLDVLASALG